MAIRRLLAASLALLVVASLLLARTNNAVDSGAAMVAAGRAFLKTLDENQSSRCLFGYADKERLNWHFIPRKRQGLPIRDLEGARLQAALKLLASGLSEAGYDQALNVMSLEEVLYLLEGGDRQTRRSRRDPQKYYISIFGKPAAKGTWGWRIEGHHLSLNYTITDGQLLATTPEFFGANPGTIDAGPGRRIRVLGREEDIARSILANCSADQQKVVWRSRQAPDDLRGGGVAQPETTEPVGLPVSKMNPVQKKLMQTLLTEYLRNMPGDVQRQRRTEINKAGLENISFAWWGSEKINQRHYYRVQGPTFLIEYNNTQNSANHVHSIWRNLAGDFNVPIDAK
ncbi:MAG: DUF3500 domain-containing protein [Planctomycetaceae bacterium]|jgi:hypothetical protein|nr:DUF3500 domain-containing protein [Planctomycetaceae bacterium]